MRFLLNGFKMKVKVTFLMHNSIMTCKKTINTMSKNLLIFLKIKELINSVKLTLLLKQLKMIN